MRIKPVILCGGSGTRLWTTSKNNLPKQFIDFGGWTLFQKTLLRIKGPLYDYPIISTNKLYLKLVKKYLLRYKVKKYKIILEPSKKNTGAAILSSALLKDIENHQPMLFLPADHLIDKISIFNRSIKINKKHLNERNIFVFGIKPSFPSSQYGYFLTKKNSHGVSKVIKFLEKPNFNKAKKIIKKNGYWNSGILFAKKESIINNFKQHQTKTLKFCEDSFKKSKIFKNTIFLNKTSFDKVKSQSFDYAILERSKYINGIKLNIPWSDLGSWKEISNIFKKNKQIYFEKSNVFKRPWGKYTNLFNGKGFLIKELVINSKSSISLQKHYHRSEYWTVVSGKPKITLNSKIFYRKVNETIFVPKGAVHRIENKFKKPVKIMEVQIGTILKESDIIRFKDVYGRIQ